ncbi:hypothetical protein MMC07_006017 [Pseudocyphellaria aurata]|nr:hypothetical protein [Pseudocyphellaria aurata]
MIERKDTPAPFMQRRPPPSLDLRTPVKKRPSYGDSPPRTPPYRVRTRGQPAVKAQVNQPTPRETHLNGLKDGPHARGGGKEHRNERISHDLSFSDNARHSVVDHMLLSLNPDQPKLFSTPPESTSVGSNSRFTSPKSSRRRGHTQSSSLNSDYVYPSDDSPLRSSGQVTRGRHSNSSSNFQSALGKIDSMRGGEDMSDGTRAATYQAQRAFAGERAAASMLRKSRKSSKSSGSSSVDFGNLMGQPRWQTTRARRSTSFDQKNRGADGLPLNSTSNSSAWQSVSSPIHYDNSDAAPTPTVPAGPRSRDRSPGFPPQPAHAPPTIPRKTSDKSSKSHNNRRNKGGDQNRDTSAETWNDHRDTRRDSQQIPSIPAFIISRNSSPTRTRSETPPMGSNQSSGVQVPDQPKERPGFFRRVFGSSRNASLSPTDSRSTQVQSSHDSIRADSRSGFSSPNKLFKPPPNENTAHPPKEPGTPLLAKKPSSFFRRRKKSLSESNASPFVPLHLQPHFKADSNLASTDQEFESSPVSSLREVMDPYLSSAIPSQARRDGLAQARANAKGVEAKFNMLSTSRPMTIKPVLSSQESVLGKTGSSARSPPRNGSSMPRDRPRSRAKLSAQDIPTSSHQPKPQSQSSSHDNNDCNRIDNKMIKSKERSNSTRVDAAVSRQAPGMETTSVNENLSLAETSKPTGKKPLQQRPVDVTNTPELQSQPSQENTLPKSSSVPAPSVPVMNVTPNDWHPVARSIPLGRDQPQPDSSGKSNRVWLEPADSHEDLRKLSDLDLPIQGAPVSPASDYHSTLSTIPTTKTDDSKVNSDIPTNIIIDGPGPDRDATAPTADDRIQAKRIFDGDETFVPKAKAAAWLGEGDPDRARARSAYMEFFDWQNLNILASLRDFCGRLLLKGETQQVDRVLDAFSARWCVCNPNHGFRAKDVVHTICYSILLLNTDLHMADIEQKMTRAQFIKNTLPTVRRIANDAATVSAENSCTATLPSTKPRAESQSPTYSTEQCDRRSFEVSRPTYRLTTRPSDLSDHAIPSGPPTPLDYETPADDCGPLVKSQFRGKMTTWELQVEIILKDFFNSIRQQRLPLHGNDKENVPDQPVQFNSLSAMTGNMLRRTPSMLSKSGSEHLSYRGRPLEHRLGTGRWTSKTRSRPRIYPASTVGSSRTSLEDQSSIWSPSVSSTWSKYSLGKTQTTLSMDSFGSCFPQGDYQKSIGFANALSQAIIREESGGDSTEDNPHTTPLLDDESLELAGAPWAKEGIVKHKHHLESVDKKAKDRNWMEIFAVIEKGWMRLFSFNMNAKSLRQKAKNQKAAGGVVGGGNWTDSAEKLGKFLLRQTIASALPSPGYSKSRPHVWALSLPTGAVHLFQVGTPEIVKEFVTTANYWSARLSKEPLVGGVSNIEYGWSDAVINTALVQSENMPIVPRPSLQSSIRSSVDQGSCRPRLPGDKIAITDWTYPQQSMLASVLLEADQLKALIVYVKNIEEELQRHNELRAAMLLAFSPRHPNSNKAMANWERKSSYLLREIVKFRTYIDCLQTAETQKEKIYASRVPAPVLGAAASEEQGTGKDKEGDGLEGVAKEGLPSA